MTVSRQAGRQASSASSTAYLHKIPIAQSSITVNAIVVWCVVLCCVYTYVVYMCSRRRRSVCLSDTFEFNVCRVPQFSNYLFFFFCSLRSSIFASFFFLVVLAGCAFHIFDHCIWLWECKRAWATREPLIAQTTSSSCTFILLFYLDYPTECFLAFIFINSFLLLLFRYFFLCFRSCRIDDGGSCLPSHSDRQSERRFNGTGAAFWVCAVCVSVHIPTNILNCTDISLRFWIRIVWLNRVQRNKCIVYIALGRLKRKTIKYRKERSTRQYIHSLKQY